MLRLSNDLKEFKRRKNIARISGIILVIGILVGMIGSSSAVRKYLKV